MPRPWQLTSAAPCLALIGLLEGCGIGAHYQEVAEAAERQSWLMVGPNLETSDLNTRTFLSLEPWLRAVVGDEVLLCLQERFERRAPHPPRIQLRQTAFSPGGRRLASEYHKDGVRRICVVDVPSRSHHLVALPPDGRRDPLWTELAWSPDERRFIGYKAISRWRTKAGTDMVEGSLFLVSEDKEGWVSRGLPAIGRRPTEGTAAITKYAWETPEVFLYTEGNQISRYDVETGKSSAVVQGYNARSLGKNDFIYETGPYIADEISLWEPPDHKVLRRRVGADGTATVEEVPKHGRVTCISPDGRYVMQVWEGLSSLYTCLAIKSKAFCVDLETGRHGLFLDYHPDPVAMIRCGTWVRDRYGVRAQASRLAQKRARL